MLWLYFSWHSLQNKVNMIHSITTCLLLESCLYEFNNVWISCTFHWVLLHCSTISVHWIKTQLIQISLQKLNIVSSETELKQHYHFHLFVTGKKMFCIHFQIDNLNFVQIRIFGAFAQIHKVFCRIVELLTVILCEFAQRPQSGPIA